MCDWHIKLSRIIFVLLVIVGQSQAQEAISPEKRALIKELLVITNATKNAESVVNTMSAQVEKDMAKFLSEAMSRGKQLSAGEQAEMQKRIDESSKRADQRVKELMAQRINFGEVVESISLKLYNRFFTEAELKDLVAFYKSATGQKTIKIMPQLFAESVAQTSEQITPKLQQIIREVMDEETKQIKAKEN